MDTNIETRIITNRKTRINTNKKSWAGRFFANPAEIFIHGVKIGLVLNFFLLGSVKFAYGLDFVTQFFLSTTTASEPQPNNAQSGSNNLQTDAGYSANPSLELKTTAGTALSTFTYTFTSNGNTYNHSIQRWISPILGNQTIYSTWTWTVQGAWKESGPNDNFYPRAVIYIWNGKPGDAQYDAARRQGVNIASNTASEMDSVTPLDFTPLISTPGFATVNVQKGDRLVVEIEVRQVSNSGGPVYFYHNAPNGASYGYAYITCSNNIIVGTEPYISARTPADGPEGTQVTITGYNFGTTTGTVKFAGTQAAASDIVSWADRTIVCKVPAYALEGDIVVTADGVDSNGINFEVSPRVDSVSTYNIQENSTGKQFTINGKTFLWTNSPPLSVAIMRNGSPVSGITVTNTQITASSQSITVTVDINYDVAVGTCDVRITDDESYYGQLGQCLYVVAYATSAATSPQDDSIQKSITSIAGNANNTGITGQVKVKIKNLTNSLWWAGWPSGGWADTDQGFNITASGLSSWALDAMDVSTISWSNARYEIISKVMSTQYGGVEYKPDPDTTGIQFYFDNTPPAITVSQPQDSAIRKTTFTFTGSASDNSTGYTPDSFGIQATSGVAASIRDQDNNVWNSGLPGWQYLPPSQHIWNIASGSTSWSYNLPTNQWTHNFQYRVVTRAQDQAGNYSSTYATSTFVYDVYQSTATGLDQERPNSVVIEPGNGVFRGATVINAAGISGTAQDNSWGGIYWVGIALKKVGGQWWDGTGFNSSVEVWKNADDLTSQGGGNYTWNYYFTQKGRSPLWEDGAQYQVYTQCQDEVDSAEGNPDPNTEIVYTTNTFTIDKNVPISTITWPTNNSLIAKQPPAFYGVMIDTPSGSNIHLTEGMQIRFMRKSTGEHYKTGTGWMGAVNGEQWNTADYYIAGGTWSWTYPGGELTSGDYLIVARAKDAALNTQNIFNVPGSSHTVTIDADAPNTGLTKPSSEDLYYKNLTAISGTATDNLVGSKIYVQIRDLTQGATYWSQSLGQWVNYSTWNWVSWVSPWALNVGNVFTSGNRYRVKCYAEDQALNAQSIPGDAAGDRNRHFYFDSTIPASTVTVPSHQSYLSGLTMIQGTSNNDPAPAGKSYSAGMNKAQIQITKGNDAYSWRNTPGLTTVQENPTGDSGDWTDSSGAYSDGTSTATATVENSTHVFKNYSAFSIPTAASINQIKVRLDVFSGTANSGIKLEASADGGTTWLGSAWSSGTLATSETTFWVDITTWTSWTPAKINNNQIAVRITKLGAADATYLDWIPVQVIYYSEAGAWVSGLGQWSDGNAISGGWLDWYMNLNGTPWESGFTYRVRSRAIDNALDATTEASGSGNREFETVSAGQSPYVEFTYDPNPPTSLIQSPGSADTRLKLTQALVTISGTAQDGVKIESPTGGLKLNIVRKNESWAYNGTVFTDYTTETNALDAWISIESFSSYTYTAYTTSAAWWVAISSSQFDEPKQYQVRVKSKDKSGTWDVALSTRTFYCDRTVPTAVLTYPSPNQYINVQTLTTISGTCSGTLNEDVPAVPAQGYMQFKFYYLSAGTTYWYPVGGGAWSVSEPVWQNVTSMDGGLNSQVWYFTDAGLTWDVDRKYYVMLKVKDKAGNEQTPATAYFIYYYDITKPTATITNITNGSYKNESLITISGTASDYPTQEVASVKVNIVKTFPEPKKTWNGSSWDNDEQTDDAHWLACTFTGFSSGTWTYPGTGGGSTPTWYQSGAGQGANYRLAVKSEDRIGNYQLTNSTVNFTFDVYEIPPDERPMSSTGTLTSPPADDYHTKDWENIRTSSGSAQDISAGKLQGVKVLLRKFKAGTTYYWTGTQWTTISGDLPPADSWPGANASDSAWDEPQEDWYFNGPATLGSDGWEANLVPYEINAEARDYAGNYEKYRTTQTFVYDTLAPNASITYPDDQGYVSQTGIIYGPWSDTSPGKVNKVEVRIKDLGYSTTYYSVTGSTWVNTTPDNAWNDAAVYTSSWVLNVSPWETGKTYEINVRARDKALNWQVAYDTHTNIKADFDKPSSVVSFPVTQTSYAPTQLTALNGTAQDVLPGGELEIVELRLHRWYPSGSSPSEGWWHGSGWATSEVWFSSGAVDNPVGQPAQWSYNSSGVTWHNDASYDITSRAKDKAANRQAVPFTSTFTVTAPPADTEVTLPPKATVGESYAYVKDALTTISGTANADTNSVEFAIKRESDTYNWFGSSFSTPAGAAVWNWISTPLVAGVWKYELVSPWVNGSTYTIRSRGFGTVNEPEASWPTNIFLYDTENPNSAIILPLNNSSYRALPTISGTAWDLPSLGKIDEVRAAIRKISGGSYYWWSVSQSTWVAGSDTPAEGNFNLASWSNPNWYLVTTSTQLWEDGREYKVYSRTKDKSTRLQSPYTESNFLFDTSSPSAKITTLTNDSIYSQLTQITGTAWDTDPDAGGSLSAGKLETVQIQIKRNETIPMYWTGTGWTDTESWSTATIHVPDVSVSSWDYANLPTSVQWTQNALYTILSRARDKALPTGNTQQVYVVTESSINIRWDNQPPGTAITNPQQDNKINPLGTSWTIYGTASDSPAGVVKANIKLQLSRVQGASTWYWDHGSAEWFENDSAKEFAPASYDGSLNWSYTNATLDSKLISDQRYTIKVKASDNANPANSSSFPTSPDNRYVEVIIDTTPPLARVTYPQQGKYYQSTALANLSGTANADLAGLQKAEIKVMRGAVTLRDWGAANFTGTNGTIDWSSGTTGISWTGGQEHSVWTKAYDLAGSTQVVVSSITFTVDDDAPLVTFYEPTSLTNWASYTNSSGTASDTISSSISIVNVAIQNLNGNKWWNGISTFNITSAVPVWTSTASYSPTTWQYNGFNGYLEENTAYRFHAKAIDAAGNEATISSTIDKSTPTVSIVYPANGQAYRSIPTISGNWSDAPAGIAAGELKFVLKSAAAGGLYRDPADGNWKDKDTLIAAGRWLPWTATEVWPTSWTFAGVNWTNNNSQHYLWIEAKDRAGNRIIVSTTNVEGNLSANSSFMYDATEPISLLTSPSSGTATYSQLTTISGTARTSAGGSGANVSEVKIRIRKSPAWLDGEWWDGVDGSSGTIVEYGKTGWISQGPPTWEWYWNVENPGVMWTDDSIYYINTVGYDLATNYETAFSTYIVIYDITKPTSKVTSHPLSGTTFAPALTAISGTCNDANTNASGVNQVDVAMKRLSNDQWWGGWDNQNFSESSIDWSSATVYTSSWTYAIDPNKWTDGTSYWIISRARDRAINYETGWATNTVIIDTTPPSGAIIWPTISMSSNVLLVTQINGTANDSSPGQLKIIKLYIQGINSPNTTNKYWTGSSWTVNETWLDVTANPSWSYNSSGVNWETTNEPGYQYRAVAVAYDQANNSHIARSTTTFNLYSPYPESKVTVPTSGDYYKIAGSPFTIQGTADAYANSIRVNVSSAPGYTSYYSTSTGWQTSEEFPNNPALIGGSPPYSWSLTVSSGVFIDGITYRIRSRGTGSAGNEPSGNIESVDLYVDRTLPQSTVSPYPVNNGHYQTIITISGTAIDQTPAEPGTAGKIDKVELFITTGTSPKYYYTGSAWQDTPIAIQVGGFVSATTVQWSWTVTSTATAWGNNGTYEIWSKTYDKAKLNGNEETNPEGDKITIVIDTITQPQDFFSRIKQFIILYRLSAAQRMIIHR